MGLNIYCFCEIKVEGEWYYYAELNINRNSELLKYLGYDKELNNLKGLPNDVTKLTLINKARHSEFMSPSWLTSEEVLKLISKFPEIEDYERYNYLFGGRYTYFKEFRKEYPVDIQDFRWIYWAD